MTGRALGVVVVALALTTTSHIAHAKEQDRWSKPPAPGQAFASEDVDEVVRVVRDTKSIEPELQPIVFLIGLVELRWSALPACEKASHQLMNARGAGARLDDKLLAGIVDACDVGCGLSSATLLARSRAKRSALIDEACRRAKRAPAPAALFARRAKLPPLFYLVMRELLGHIEDGLRLNGTAYARSAGWELEELLPGYLDAVVREATK